MKFKSSKSFDDYFSIAEQNTRDVIEENSPFLIATKEYHSFFINTLFQCELTSSHIGNLLSVNCFTLFLNAVRIATTGSSIGLFPILRSMLESSCYAYQVSRNKDLEKIWMHRHRSTDDHKLCRKKFSNAVGNTAKNIQKLSASPEGTEDWINSAYQLAIDFGAHPNQKAIFENISIDQERYKDQVAVDFIMIRNSSSFEINRQIMSCLDFGLITCTILCCLSDKPSDQLIIHLHKLNDIKEDLAKEYYET